MSEYSISSLTNTASATRKDFQITLNKNTDTQIPLSIINGKEKGNTLTLMAGIHGYEYPSIIALQEFLKEIDPYKLNGTLLIIPIANIRGFYQRMPFLNPDDGKNLNRVFPGSKFGSPSEQIAHWITQNIITNTDILIDIHGGDAPEDLLPFSCFYHNNENKENTEIAKKLSGISGLPYIVSYPYDISPNDKALYALKQATQDNTIALCLETGKLGNLQKDCVSMLKNALYNILGYLEMYPQPHPQKTGVKQIYLTRQTYIKSPEQGIFYSTYQSGDSVKIGDNLGYITDVFGNFLHRIESPATGIILYKIATPPINKDETLFCIGS